MMMMMMMGPDGAWERSHLLATENHEALPQLTMLVLNCQRLGLGSTTPESKKGSPKVNFPSRQWEIDFWKPCPDRVVNEFTPSNTLAWHAAGGARRACRRPWTRRSATPWSKPSSAASLSSRGHQVYHPEPLPSPLPMPDYVGSDTKRKRSKGLRCHPHHAWALRS